MAATPPTPKNIRLQPESKPAPNTANKTAAAELGGGVSEQEPTEEKTITLAMPPTPQKTRSFIADDENEPIPEELADRPIGQDTTQPEDGVEHLDMQGHTEQTVAEMRAGAKSIEKEVLDDEEYSSKTLAEMAAGRKRLEHWRRREANMPKIEEGPKNTIIRRGPKLPA